MSWPPMRPPEERIDKPELSRGFRFFYATGLASSTVWSLTGPFWVVYFSKIGLSYLDISLLIIANHAASLAFEIPTGAVADLWGRKPSVLLSFLICGICSIGIYFSKSFPLLLFLFALSGFGSTFASGARSAWFVDEMTAAGAKGMTGYWGRLASGGRIGSLVGFLLGTGIVSAGGLRTLWLMEGLGSLLIALGIQIFGKETRQERKLSSLLESYRKIIFEGSTHLFKTKLLALFTFGGMIWFLSTGILSLAWQPFLEDTGISPKYFGLVLCGYMILGIFTARQTGKISQRLGNESRLLQIVSLLCSLLTISMAFVPGFNWIFYILYGGMYSLHGPAFQAFLNKKLPSSERATILSTYNMAVSIATILSMLVFGFGAERFGLRVSLLFSSFICLTSIVFFCICSSLERQE